MWHLVKSLFSLLQFSELNFNNLYHRWLILKYTTQSFLSEHKTKSHHRFSSWRNWNKFFQWETVIWISSSSLNLHASVNSESPKKPTNFNKNFTSLISWEKILWHLLKTEFYMSNSTQKSLFFLFILLNFHKSQKTREETFHRPVSQTDSRPSS